MTNLIILGLAALVAYIGYRVGYSTGYADAANGVPHCYTSTPFSDRERAERPS